MASVLRDIRREDAEREEKTLQRGRQRLELCSHKAWKPTAMRSWKKLGRILPQSIRGKVTLPTLWFGTLGEHIFVVLFNL